MNEALIYLDSSAIVKLIVPEPETGALLELLAEWPERVSSALARVEVSRAVKRAGDDPIAMQRTGEVLDRLSLIRIDAEVLSAAANMPPTELRTLDAIHLASALRVGAREMLVYDRRLADAAEAAGLEVLSPGA